MDDQLRIREIVGRLRREFAGATTELTHKNALELLIATVLSAQCTDKRVNIVTKDLFKKYRTAKDYAHADLMELEKDIRSVNFFRNKAKNIRRLCRMIVDEHNSRVPDTMEGLLRLPGVARKTANIILGIWYGKAEGVVVDTHVARITQRLGLTSQTKPEKIEKDLMDRLPRGEWISFSNMAILHGRKTCKARNPDCKGCKLADLCPSVSKIP